MKHPLEVVFWSFWIAVAILIGLGIAANAQSRHDHSTMGVTGDFYQQWMIPPKRESSCCSEKDCYVTTILQVDGGWVYKSRATGKFEKIDPKLVEENQSDPLDSPDGQSHVCELASGTLLCAVRGMGQ